MTRAALLEARHSGETLCTMVGFVRDEVREEVTNVQGHVLPAARVGEGAGDLRQAVGRLPEILDHPQVASHAG